MLLLACAAPQDSALPPDDDMSVVSSGDADERGFLAVPLLSPDWQGSSEVRVLDGAGQVVWSLAEPDTLEVLLEVRFALDGSGLWLFSQDLVPLDAAGFRLQHIGWDGVETQRIEDRGHTSFELLPDGGFVVLRKRVEEIGGQVYLIDHLVEYDAEGLEQGVVWATTDDLDPRDFPTVALMPTMGDPPDWFHANSVTVGADGDFYVSLGDVSALVRVSPEGELVQGIDSLGFFTDPGTGLPPVELPHSLEPLEDGRWLAFNRRSPSESSVCSELVELELDSTGERVERSFAWWPEDCPKTAMLGSAMALPGGRRLVNLGSAGRLVVIDEAGGTELQVDLDLGMGFGQGDWSATGPEG
jgi:hypothetical protein